MAIDSYVKVEFKKRHLNIKAEAIRYLRPHVASTLKDKGVVEILPMDEVKSGSGSETTEKSEGSKTPKPKPKPGKKTTEVQEDEGIDSQDQEGPDLD